jgi:hypothetical protein
MSKRHQSSRRKTYGRRQHEVRERSQRRREPEMLDVRVDSFGTAGRPEGVGLELDGGHRPLSYAPAD